jgi:PAS domain S-box-containing protein
MYRFTPDGYILDANPAFIDMLGFSSIDELAVHEIECRNLRLGVNWKKVKKTMEGDGEIKGLESAWNRRDGTKIFVLENIRAIRGSDGSILFYEGSVEDITERKVAENKLKEVNLNLEKEIRRRTAQLIKANECLRKEISERKLKEEELNRSYNQLRALTKHLESVREEERAKISREVHDELGQSLTGLKIDLDFLSKQLCESGDNRENAKLMEVIRNMASLVDYNIQSVRRIAIELRPSVLDDLGIVAVIEWQLQDFEKRTGIKCSFICGVEDIPLDREVSTALYRIFKEVITNVARHSKATTVTVRLREYRSKCLLVIEDNGVGISDDQIVAQQSLGLLGIKERASSIGGDVRITSKFNGGAKITVMVPK